MNCICSRELRSSELLHSEQWKRPVETWWHTVKHGRGSEGETGEWSGQPVPFTLPGNMVYPTLLPLMRTPRLPVVDWTDAPRRFKWTRPLCRKTKSGFCACVITFKHSIFPYRRFGTIYRSHLQGSSIQVEFWLLDTWKWDREVLTKFR